MRLGSKRAPKRRGPVWSPRSGERLPGRTSLPLRLVKLVNVVLSLCRGCSRRQPFRQVSDALCRPDNIVWWRRGDSYGTKGRDVGGGAHSPGLPRSRVWGGVVAVGLALPWTLGILALSVG